MDTTKYKRLSSHGTISIPVAVRRELGLQGRDPMELAVKDGTITLRAYTPRCVFCGETDGVKMLAGKGVCPACIAKLKEDFRNGKPEKQDK